MGREGQWREEARSCRGAGSRWGLWRLKPVSAGRLASPSKEEGRASVEDFRESSLPDNGTLNNSMNQERSQRKKEGYSGLRALRGVIHDHRG